MAMPTVIFDFDSVLVPCESLEVVLARSEGVSAEAFAEIEAITVEGMEGRMPFEESLRKRLELAQPNLGTLMAFGWRLADQPTTGAPELIAKLGARGHEVWIVSGGFQEILVAVGERLGVPAQRIHGVQALWDDDGAFAGLDPACAFLQSKVAGLQALGPEFSRPVVGVGDGATDLALREAGLVDHFVAYTEHARRDPVVAGADAEAGSMEALSDILGNLLA